MREVRLINLRQGGTIGVQEMLSNVVGVKKGLEKHKKQFSECQNGENSFGNKNRFKSVQEYNFKSIAQLNNKYEK